MEEMGFLFLKQKSRVLQPVGDQMGNGRNQNMVLENLKRSAFAYGS